MKTKCERLYERIMDDLHHEANGPPEDYVIACLGALALGMATVFSGIHGSNFRMVRPLAAKILDAAREAMDASVVESN